MASSDSEPYISIIIPTRTNEKDLIDCILSTFNLGYDLKKLEIIIWDNNSKGSSKETVNNFLASMSGEMAIPIQLIENNDNYGVYTSRDELIKRVNIDSDFILSIDDDVLLPPQLFTDLMPVFKNDPKVGIVGPRIVYDDDPAMTAHGAGFINWWLGRYTTKDAKKTIECDYVIGCCMLIKKEMVDKIGGFDRDYFTSHGEVDFCLRAKKKGYKVVYEPNLIVRHRVEKGGTRSLERLYYVYRNKLLVIKKNVPIPQKFIALGIYSLFWLPKALLDSVIINRKIIFTEWALVIKAMVDGWLNRTGKRV
ncbi:glycosyltransferase family 2 protein [Thermodesulfobacteriota bacterium]